MKSKSRFLIYLTPVILFLFFSECTPEEPVIERGSFSGSVLSKNLRVSGAIVKLKRTGASNTISQETASNGTFNFTDLTFGVYSIEVELEGHLPYRKISEITIDENTRDIENYTATLIPYGTLSGKVVSELDNRPITSASVELSGDRRESIQTNSSGDFTFNEITAGSYRMKISANGFIVHEEDLSIEDGESVSLQIKLKPFPSISGTVVNRQDDSPVFEAKVSLGGTATSDVLTDSQGTFIFPNLSAGDYTVKVDKQGFQAIDDVINLQDGASVNKVYKLLPEEVSTSVSGKVVNSENQQPIPGVKLSLSGALSQDVFTDENGNYSFSDLTAGAYFHQYQQGWFCPKSRRF